MKVPGLTIQNSISLDSISNNSGSPLNPSATLNTYGAVTTFNLGAGAYKSIAIPPGYLAAIASAGFGGGETFTVKIIFTWSDGSTTFVEIAFSGAGETAVTPAQLYSPLCTGKAQLSLCKVGGQAKSSVNSSAVTGDIKLLAMNV